MTAEFARNRKQNLCHRTGEAAALQMQMLRCHAGNRFEQFCVLNVCLAPKQPERTKTLCTPRDPPHEENLRPLFPVCCHGSTNARRPTQLGPIQKRVQVEFSLACSSLSSVALQLSEAVVLPSVVVAINMCFRWNDPFLKCLILMVASVVKNLPFS